MCTAGTGIKDSSKGIDQQQPPQKQLSNSKAQQQQPQHHQHHQQPKQQQKVKKKKPLTPEHQLLVNVQAAAKSKNAAAGVAAYHAAIAAGTKIQPDLYSTLLYLCSGGDAWELPLRQQLTESTALVEDIMQRAAADAAQQEEACTAEADALANPDASAATTVGGSISPAPTQTALTSAQAAADGNGYATAVATLSVAGGTSTPTGIGKITGVELLSADGGAPTAVGGSSQASASQTGKDNIAAAVAAVEAASLPQLTPFQLREEGQAIFDHMQVKGFCSHSGPCVHVAEQNGWTPQAGILK